MATLNPISWLKCFIRRILLHKKFPTSVIYAGTSVDQSSTFGEYSVLFRDVTLINSSLGAYSYIQSGSVVCNAEIGKFCSIASNVSIGLASHPVHMVSTSPVFYDNSQPLPKFLINSRVFTETVPRTAIGADVWIGQGVLIKAGVTIGVGAVIGAGSIVTKDIDPYTIAAGNPCKSIRLRFEGNVVNRLISSEWWNKSNNEIELMASFFAEPLKLLEALEKFKC